MTEEAARSGTVREGLAEEGALRGRTLAVDRLVNRRLTRVQASDIRSYEPGDTVVFHRDVYGCRASDVCIVMGHDDGRVVLAHPDGERRFRPSGNASRYLVKAQELRRDWHTHVSRAMTAHAHPFYVVGHTELIDRLQQLRNQPAVAALPASELAQLDSTDDLGLVVVVGQAAITAPAIGNHPRARRRGSGNEGTKAARGEILDRRQPDAAWLALGR